MKTNCNILWFICLGSLHHIFAKVPEFETWEDRFEWLGASSSEVIRPLAMEECAEYYQNANYLRAFAEEFLMVFLLESDLHMEDIIEQLRTLTIDDNEIENLKFYEDVSKTEIKEMVEKHIGFILDTMQQCMFLCKKLEANQLEDLTNDIKALKDGTANLKRRVFVCLKDVAYVIKEFGYYLWDLVIDYNEDDAAFMEIRNLMYGFYNIMKEQHKNMLGARHSLLATIKLLIETLNYMTDKKT